MSQQLQMVWPANRLSTPPQVFCPPGYGLRNAEVCQTYQPGKDQCHLEWSDQKAQDGKPRFYHCRLTLRDGNLAVASPVWIDGNL